jgi:hemerythrin
MVFSYCKKLIDGEIKVIDEILEFLKQWLVNHIQGTDTKYIDCFKKNGFK